MDLYSCGTVGNRYAELLHEFGNYLCVNGEYSADELKYRLDTMIKSNPSVLIFDITALQPAEYSNFNKCDAFFRWLKSVFPMSQIIVLAADIKESFLCKVLVQCGIYDFIINIPYDVKARRDSDIKNRIYWCVENPKTFGEVQAYLSFDNAISEKETESTGIVAGLFGRKKNDDGNANLGIVSAPTLDRPKNGKVITIASFGRSNEISVAKRIAEQAAGYGSSTLLLVLDPVFSLITQCEFSMQELDACDGWLRYAADCQKNENAEISAHWRDFPSQCFKSPGIGYYTCVTGTNASFNETMRHLESKDQRMIYDSVITGAKENFDSVIIVAQYGTLAFDVADSRSEDSFIAIEPDEVYSRFFGTKESYLVSYIIDYGSKKDYKRLNDALMNGVAVYEGSICVLSEKSKSKEFLPILANLL